MLRARARRLTDSLRAYELPALEAIPASAPLAMDGTVTALWTCARWQERAGRGAQCGKANTRWTVLRRFAISCSAGLLALPAVGANAAALRRHAARGDRRRSVAEARMGMARRLVLDGLTRWMRMVRCAPALASGWESDNADHRWQFRLRPGVHFHDGSPLTSAPWSHR